MPDQKIPKLAVILSLLMLAALVVLIATNALPLRELLAAFRHVTPGWLVLILGLQAVTYIFLSGVWWVVTRAGGVALRIRDLARLAVEKLAVDQLLHIGGIAGNAAALKIMEKLGVPTPLALEALILDMLTYYAAYAALGLAALALLVFEYHAFVLFPTLLALFVAAMLGLVWGILWLVRHRAWQPPRWLRRFSFVKDIHEHLSDVSDERLRNPKLVITGLILQVGIFLADAATLWAILHSLGVAVGLTTAFLGFALASAVGLVTLLPSGLGTFEASATGVLVLLGVPFSAALVGTLLLRGFTFWLPLAPGFVLIHKDLLSKEGVAKPEA